MKYCRTYNALYDSGARQAQLDFHVSKCVSCVSNVVEDAPDWTSFLKNKTSSTEENMFSGDYSGFDKSVERSEFIERLALFSDLLRGVKVDATFTFCMAESVYIDDLDLPDLISWLAEEVGELAQLTSKRKRSALRGINSPIDTDKLEEELGDVFNVLSLIGIKLGYHLGNLINLGEKKHARAHGHS